MGRPLQFWFTKVDSNPFENVLDIVRETLNDAGARDYRLKGIEITSEAGVDEIHRELTSGLAGKLRGIYIGDHYDTLSPAFAPRPMISQLAQFRDYAYATSNLENPFPQESLMEFSARLSYKTGPLLLMNADSYISDGYICFQDGNISYYGYKFMEEVVLRLFRSGYKLDIYNPGPGLEEQIAGKERLIEAAERSGMDSAQIEIHNQDMRLPFWHIALEGLNMFYGTKLENSGTAQTNIATLLDVSDPGIGLYDIYPDGVSYSYPEKPAEESKKPWWKVW